MASILECLAALAIMTLLSYCYSGITTYLGRQKAARDHGCQPPPSIIQRDPVFGLDIVLQLFCALTENRRNLSLVHLFTEYGHTFQARSWLSSKIYTIEPQNVQAMLSTDFASWGVSRYVSSLSNLWLGKASCVWMAKPGGTPGT